MKNNIKLEEREGSKDPEHAREEKAGNAKSCLATALTRTSHPERLAQCSSLSASCYLNKIPAVLYRKEYLAHILEAESLELRGVIR